VIAEFSKFLPAECEYQQDAEAEAAENEVEYYDEEVSDPEDKYSDEEPEEEKKNEEAESEVSFHPKENAESTAAETDKEEGQKPSEGQGGFFISQPEEEDDGKDFEYDSDYDEQGKYIWGEEGEDWDFYYDEDKEAFELGLPTVPEPLNPSALPQEEMLKYDLGHATGIAKPTNKEFEAKYMKAKKKKKLSVVPANKYKDEVDEEYDMLKAVAEKKSPTAKNVSKSKPAFGVQSPKASPFGPSKK